MLLRWATVTCESLLVDCAIKIIILIKSAQDTHGWWDT